MVSKLNLVFFLPFLPNTNVRDIVTNTGGFVLRDYIRWVFALGDLVREPFFEFIFDLNKKKQADLVRSTGGR